MGNCFSSSSNALDVNKQDKDLSQSEKISITSNINKTNTNTITNSNNSSISQYNQSNYNVNGKNRLRHVDSIRLSPDMVVINEEYIDDSVKQGNHNHTTNINSGNHLLHHNSYTDGVNMNSSLQKPNTVGSYLWKYKKRNTIEEDHGLDIDNLDAITTEQITISNTKKHTLWQRNYAVLFEGSLNFFEKPRAKFPFGSTKKGRYPSLKGMTVTYDTTSLFTLALNYSDYHGLKSLTLRFDNEDVCHQWHESILSHIEYCNNIQGVGIYGKFAEDTDLICDSNEGSDDEEGSSSPNQRRYKYGFIDVYEIIDDQLSWISRNVTIYRDGRIQIEGNEEKHIKLSSNMILKVEQDIIANEKVVCVLQDNNTILELKFPSIEICEEWLLLLQKLIDLSN